MDTRVILILIDGLRADAIARAETPVMDRVLARGTYSLAAKTVMPSVTLPCHTSLFFSAPPTRHGITTNTWMPMARPIAGLFDVLQQHDLLSASFYNWEQLRDLSAPGALDFSLFIRNSLDAIGKGDLALARQAIDWLTAHPFHFAFLYLGQTDEVGHREGWMSQPYLDSVHYADQAIGEVIAALPDDVHYIITADHGGHGRNHGTELPEDMTIPVLVQSSGGAAVDLGRELVSIMDIAPSILSLFGLPAPAAWEGSSFISLSSAEGG